MTTFLVLFVAVFFSWNNSSCWLVHLFFSFCHSTFNCCRKLFALLSRLGFVWFQCGSDFALHCTFCCVGYRDFFTLHVIFQVKSPTRPSYVSTYAMVTIHCIFANILHNYFSQNVLIAQIAQNAQVAASSVASRGETACVHLREAPEEDSSAHLPTLCPDKYKYGTHICRYSQKT